MFDLPFVIPSGKRDENGNVICYVRLNGEVEYVKGIENYKIDLEKNNTIIIYEGEAKPKRIVIGARRGNLLVLKRTKYSSKLLSISFKDNSKCYIGEDSSFVETFLHLREGKNIFIGDDCQFSTGIYVWNSDAHSILDKDGKPVNYANDVYIGNHVWVCQNSQILKGTHVADNSVIGALSLVNKKFLEENVIIAGNPAKIVKSGIGGWSRAAPSLYEKHKIRGNIL